MRYHMCQFSDKTNSFNFLGPNLPKNEFWGRDFKNLASQSVPPKYHVSQFSVKMDGFEFFGLNLRKLPNYVWYFGSNIVENVAESWLEVGGASWMLKWVEQRWMELGETGWRWVHNLVIPIICGIESHFLINYWF